MNIYINRVPPFSFDVVQSCAWILIGTMDIHSCEIQHTYCEKLQSVIMFCFAWSGHHYFFYLWYCHVALHSSYVAREMVARVLWNPLNKTNLPML